MMIDDTKFKESQGNGVLPCVSVAVAFADWINKNDYEKIHGNRWCKKYMSITYSSIQLYEMWVATER